MKLLIKIIISLMFFSIPVFSQEKNADAPKSEEKKHDVETARMKRKKAKAEWKEKRKQERADRKAKQDYEKRLQTKKTRKQMRKDRRKADRVNQNKREFFLIRLFKPKPRTGPW